MMTPLMSFMKPGQAYNGESVANTTRAFSDLFGTYGYAFARVDSKPDIDRATGQVVVTFVAEPQRRVYVRKVVVSGNSRTRDEVIRREFRFVRHLRRELPLCFFQAGGHQRCSQSFY